MDLGQILLALIGLGLCTGFIPIVLIVLAAVIIQKLVKSSAQAVKNIPQIHDNAKESFEDKIARFETHASKDDEDELDEDDDSR